MNIVRVVGTPNHVELTLKSGRVIRVNRDPSNQLFIPEYGAFVPAAPDDLHFIFETPKEIVGSSYMCSCGSPAVIVGSNAYNMFGSPEGMMFVCQHYLDFARHSDGSR